MTASLRKFLYELGGTFWLVPGLMVLAGIFGGVLTVELDRSGLLPDWTHSAWLYNGGAAGARTLLGAIAASTIGVAGTVFSITIAALSLAAGQMGPRLLQSFIRDRYNQITLGAFLGTFCYAMMVLRSVRSLPEGSFVPHLSLTLAMVFAFACVGTLVYFVGHMAGRINVGTVIDLVSHDMRTAMHNLTSRDAGDQAPAAFNWDDAIVITDDRRGYLQELDFDGLANWAASQNLTIKLLVKPGDFVFPGAPIAMAKSHQDPVEPKDIAAAIRRATALDSEQGSDADIEFPIRQLVEVAVRALSPGINDPHTAILALDHLGAALCDLSARHLRTGILMRDGRLALMVPPCDYDGLLDAMFLMIRQNAAQCPAVLIRMVEVLIAVASAERQPMRLTGLQRHADLILADARQTLKNPADLADLEARHTAFQTMRWQGMGRYNN